MKPFDQITDFRNHVGLGIPPTIVIAILPIKPSSCECLVRLRLHRTWLDWWGVGELGMRKKEKKVKLIRRAHRTLPKSTIERLRKGWTGWCRPLGKSISIFYHQLLPYPLPHTWHINPPIAETDLQSINNGRRRVIETFQKSGRMFIDHLESFNLSLNSC